MKAFITLLVLFSSLNVFSANDQVGTIVKIQGQVELLSTPSKKVGTTGQQVLFEGKYYTLKKIKLGTKIENGNIIKTGKDSKLKIIFKNGDQYNVGEATSYEVSWSFDPSVKKDLSTVRLIYGTIRGVISKEGPRSGTKIVTKEAVMGVRGTDFFASQRGTSGEANFSVIRGQVEVETKDGVKKIMLPQGFTALVETKEDKKVVDIIKTSKVEFLEIQKQSVIRKEKRAQEVSKSVQKEIAELEKKAMDNTLNDIKNYDVKLYEKLKNSKVKNVDQLNTVAIKKNFDNAPQTSKKKSLDDLGLDEDVYEKYFDIGEGI